MRIPIERSAAKSEPALNTIIAISFFFILFIFVLLLDARDSPNEDLYYQRDLPIFSSNSYSERGRHLNQFTASSNRRLHSEVDNQLEVLQLQIW